MGSYAMRHIAKKNGWYPGVFDLEDVSFEEQKEHWGNMLLNYDAKIVNMKNASFNEDEAFIRPADDSKSFAGRIFSKEEWDEWRSNILENGKDYGYTIDEDTKVIISKPKQIYAEARFWIVKSNIVTSSMYKVGDRVFYSPVIDKEFTSFASAMATAIISLDYWNPADAFVIDVCRTEEGMK